MIATDLAIGEWVLLDPWFLGAIPLVWLGLLWRLRRPRAALPAASGVLLAGLPRSPRARLVALPPGLLALAATVLLVAMARPVTREVLPLRELGVDILLLIDVSSSMNADDMADTGSLRRIEAARDKALEFAQARTRDRVGMMTYALFPELRSPLTLDERALAAFLRGVRTVEPGGPEDRTAIGVALAQAARVLSGSEAKSKVVVLLTDGENNVTEILPADAAKAAVDAGVRVHTIGLGHGRIMVDPFGRGRRAIPADFSDLQEIAEITGGKFFEAVDAEALATVYGAIDEMEKVELEDPRYRTSDEFGWLLLCGAGLLLLALLLECLWIRGAP